MKDLLPWYYKHKRNLPWRQTNNPYCIWLSEIILQQTRIQTGLEYYTKFVKQYPTVQSLALANVDEVLKLWQGLGYYSRARNLHETAKFVAHELDGKFPNNFKELQKLKGVGHYTAAAIASIGFKEKVPAIDGNAFRVYARYWNEDYDTSKTNAKSFFFDLAKLYIDAKNPGDFNQAIMDLGSKICTPKKPNCTNCPLVDSCLAYQLGNQSNLPVKSKKIKIVEAHIHFKIYYSDQKTIIQKKKSSIWQGLFVFPYSSEPTNQAFLENQQKEKLKPTLIHQTKHLLTHKRLNIRFWFYNMNSATFLNSAKENHLLPISMNNLDAYAWPKPIASFLEEYKF